MPNILAIDFTNHLCSTSRCSIKNNQQFGCSPPSDQEERSSLQKETSYKEVVSACTFYDIIPCASAGPNKSRPKFTTVHELQAIAHHCGQAILELDSVGSLCRKKISCEKVVSVRTLYDLLPHMYAGLNKSCPKHQSTTDKLQAQVCDEVVSVCMLYVLLPRASACPNKFRPKYRTMSHELQACMRRILLVIYIYLFISMYISLIIILK